MTLINATFHCGMVLGRTGTCPLLSISSPMLFATRQLRRRRTAFALRKPGSPTSIQVFTRDAAGLFRAHEPCGVLSSRPFSSKASDMPFSSPDPARTDGNACPFAARPRSSHARSISRQSPSADRPYPVAYPELFRSRADGGLQTGRRSARTHWYCHRIQRFDAVPWEIGPKFGGS